MSWEEIASQVARGENLTCTWEEVQEAMRERDFLDIEIQGEGVLRDVYVGWTTAQLPQHFRGGQMFAPAPRWLGCLSAREFVLVVESLYAARLFQDEGCSLL